jgi:membrane protease YdiL (CAAX protease family)
MSEIFGLLMIFIPLGLILLLANLSQRRRERNEPYQGLAVLAYGLVVLIYILAVLLVLSLVMLIQAAQSPEYQQMLESAGITLPEQIPIASVWTLLAGVIVPSIIGCLCLTPPVRQWVSQFLPIDPYHPVHAVSLSMTMFVIINLMVTLGIGLENLVGMVRESPTDSSVTVSAAWVQAGMFCVLALIGVGMWVRRDWMQSMHRIGLTGLTLQQTVMGVLIAVGMVILVLALEFVASQLGVEPDQDVEDLTRELIGPLFESPLGIVTLGVSAALGEEMIFRGAMQPRFGLLYTALLFALVHSNYGITFSTGIVLLLGLVLGWVRMRQNTSTAMVVHAVYNMTLGLLVYFGVQSLE